MATCVFCDRDTLADPEPLSEYAYALAPLNPVTPGHKLVIPYTHVTDATTDTNLTGLVFEAAAEHARHVGDCNLITSVGPAATQTVRHLHVHVIPRRAGDGLWLPWTARAP